MLVSYTSTEGLQVEEACERLHLKLISDRPVEIIGAIGNAGTYKTTTLSFLPKGYHVFCFLFSPYCF